MAEKKIVAKFTIISDKVKEVIIYDDGSREEIIIADRKQTENKWNFVN